MNTLLVTGGWGFIGSHFVRLLLASTEWRVVNLNKLTYAGNPENLKDVRDETRYSLLKGDICNRVLVDELFQREEPRVVINFVAESHVDRSILDPSPFLDTARTAPRPVNKDVEKPLNAGSFGPWSPTAR